MDDAINGPDRPRRDIEPIEQGPDVGVQGDNIIIHQDATALTPSIAELTVDKGPIRLKTLRQLAAARDVTSRSQLEVLEIERRNALLASMKSCRRQLTAFLKVSPKDIEDSPKNIAFRAHAPRVSVYSRITKVDQSPPASLRDDLSA